MAALARGGLGIIALPYRLAAGLRNAAYDRGWKKAHRAGVPVISVGNITLGGTGKTPLVEWVARWYRKRDVRVVLLSRGYGSTGGFSDEGLLLEQNLPDVPHLQDPDRSRLSGIAVEELEAEILVLDDGFQHRQLGRDLDLVLLDALEPFGQGRLFPRGLLREPIRSLRRADLVVISRADLVAPIEHKAIREEAERHAGPLRWVLARHRPRDLIDSEGGSTPVEDIRGVRVAAFCGIGNPEGFWRTLAGLGVHPVGSRIFPDHHPYDRADVEDLAAWAEDREAELVLTTQKDLVKLRTASLGARPLRALRIGLDVMEGQELLEEALETFQPRPAPKSDPV